MNRGMCESVVVSWFEGRPDEILLYINTVIILLIPLLIVPSCVLCVVRWFIMYTCVCVCVCVLLATGDGFVAKRLPGQRG